ncbi:conserved hypothetical protein [Ricinus communis]|uniref:Uncharacterized protein n=1 Tax=Ricinus communis TaxID=3988 RepID=B9SAK2_RICCO|nr:conserved hypothetical protein [Ricinus communis]
MLMIGKLLWFLGVLSVPQRTEVAFNRSFNDAMLMKLAWGVMVNSNGLWVP